VQRQSRSFRGPRLLAALSLLTPFLATLFPLASHPTSASAGQGYAYLTKLIDQRLTVTRHTTDLVAQLAMAMRDRSVRCANVTIALPALGSTAPISSTPAVAATLVVTATSVVTTTDDITATATPVLTGPGASTGLSGTVTPTATVLPPDGTAPVTATLPISVPQPRPTILVPAQQARNRARTTHLALALQATTVITVQLPPTRPVHTLFSLLGDSPHVSGLTGWPTPASAAVAPSSTTTPTVVITAPWISSLATLVGASGAGPARLSGTLRLLGAWPGPERARTPSDSAYVAPAVAAWSPDLLNAAPLPVPTPLAGALYTWGPTPRNLAGAGLPFLVSSGPSVPLSMQAAHVTIRLPEAMARLADEGGHPTVQAPAPLTNLGWLRARHNLQPERLVPPALETSTATPTTTPTSTATPSSTATATASPSPTTIVPQNTLVITETTGSLTLLTALGKGHTAYDSDERSSALPDNAPATARRRHHKPRYYTHLWVNTVLVSTWDMATADRAAAILRGGCRGPLVQRATALADDLLALARVQVEGDRANRSVRRAYGSVYGAFLTGMEIVAVRNLNRMNYWRGLLWRYRGYQARYRAWEAREKAYWQWRAAGYAHQVAVAQWHARKQAYDRYAAELSAYQQHLPGYYAAVQAGTRAALPARPFEPAWPGSPPAFTQPQPVRLARPWYVPIPPPPPWQEPLPAPPEAPPQWQMLVQANLRGVARLGNPWGGSYYTTLREDQLLQASAFEGIGAFVTPVHGPVTVCFGCSDFAMPYHSGLDIAAPLGTRVVAANDGVVRFAGWALPGEPHRDYGLCVVIQYNQYISSLYGHLNDSIGLLVYPGQTVHAGQTVGYIGMTGSTSGPHLHFELRYQGHAFNPMLAPGINP